MRVMLTGAGGLLAAAIAREFSSDADVRSFDRAALDITDRGAVHAAVARVEPQLIVNCAAFNDVDGAEDNGAVALAANTFGVLALAEAAGRLNSTLVHYSTDFVFDGETNRPYTEEDAPRPLGLYGASKLLGEWFALEHPRAYVLRVESLFGPAGGVRRGSLGVIVERIRAGEEVPVFVDRTVSPTYTVDAAVATRRLAMSSAPAGLYHCVNSGAATWIEIAREAARVMGLRLHTRSLTLETAALRTPRPRYCALSNSKLAAIGVSMPPWQDALARWLTAAHAPESGR